MKMAKRENKSLKYALVNCDIYTGTETVYDKAIIIEDKYISNLVDLTKVPNDIEVINLHGLCVAPGFIDLQVNGGGGFLFTDTPTEKAIASIFEAHKRFGTTNFLPTIITTSLDNIILALDTIKKCLSQVNYGVLGIHIEGPYINVKRAGVHDKKHIRPLVDKELKILLEKGGNVIKILTIAPEVVDKNYIKILQSKGIHVAAGHSDATYDQAIDAFRNGVSSVTHLFNAMSQFGSREPGLVGAVLDDDDVYASIIADGIHVHFSSLRVCKKTKKKNKLLLVTDAMPPVGKPGLSFKLGELEICYQDGKCITKDGTLAGSALDMATSVRNCVQKIGIPMDEALRMASTYPAEYLGISDKYGRIEPGYLANLTIFNNQLFVKGVVISGKYESFSN